MSSHILAREIRRLRGLRKKAYVHAFAGSAPYYIVNEFPKSGGTWLAEMLADVLDLPFRRRGAIAHEPSIVHGHFLRPGRLRNVVAIFRDPRDVIVSLYFHCYFVNDRANEALVAATKARLPFDDYSDLRVNLPHFIRSISTVPAVPNFTWPQFADVWAQRPGTWVTTYEALRADTEGELSRIVASLIGQAPDEARIAQVVDHFSLARAKRRHEEQMRAGTEVPFVREGSLGGWRKHFTPESESLLAEFGYDEPMRKLGYDL